MTPADNGSSAGARLFFPGWIVVAICFLSLNFSVGIVFAAFGALVKAIVTEYDTSRAVASGVLSATALTLGLLAPSVGSALQKFSARTLMVVGCASVSLGFLLCAYVTNIYWLFAIYGTLIGAGFVAMGIVPCSTLVTRWFNSRRGLALGIINLFPGMAIFPWVVTWMVTNHGLQNAFLLNAAMMAALLPTFLLISDEPAKRGLEPLGGTPEPAVAAAKSDTSAPPRGLLTRPHFWLLSLGIAMITGVANLLTVHYTPMLQDAKLPDAEIGIVQVLYGSMLAICAPLYGAIIDRFGPFKTLIACCAIMVAGWIGLALTTPAFIAFLVLLSLVGLANGGITTLHTSTAATLFTPGEFSRSMGLGYFVKMPFLLAGPPLGGYVYDRTGSYELAIMGGLGTILVAGILFGILLSMNRAAPAPQA